MVGHLVVSGTRGGYVSKTLVDVLENSVRSLNVPRAEEMVHFLGQTVCDSASHERSAVRVVDIYVDCPDLVARRICLDLPVLGKTERDTVVNGVALMDVPAKAHAAVDVLELAD